MHGREASEAPASRSPREEIAEIYLRFGPIVSRRCRYLLRDEEAAKDATQEVFVKVMRSLELFRGEASPLTWVLKIATNHCLNQIASKRAGWRELYRQQTEHAHAAFGSTGGEQIERAEQVRRLLGKLDAETQQVAIHYFVDEMTQDEIGAALGRSLPTIRKRIAKFVRVAQKELGHDLA